MDATNPLKIKMFRCKGPCARLLQRTKENFGYSWGTADKMHGTCRKCIEARKRSVFADSEKAKEIAEQVRNDAVVKVAEKLSGAPHTAETTEHICATFGGSEAFAAEFHNTYERCREGGKLHLQTKMLGMVLMLITRNTEAGGAKKPMELMTDEELDAYVDELVTRKAQTLHLTYADEDQQAAS